MHTVSVTSGPERSTRFAVIARAVAVMIVLMLLAQLYSFETFASVLAVVVPFNDQQLTEIFATGLVLAELLALPYLLAMPLSTLMRWVSISCGVAIVLFWFFTAMTSAHATNAALFGATVVVPGGLAPFLWTLLFLTGFASVVYSDSNRLSS